MWGHGKDRWHPLKAEPFARAWLWDGKRPSIRWNVDGIIVGGDKMFVAHGPFESYGEAIETFANLYAGWRRDAVALWAAVDEDEARKIGWATTSVWSDG